MNASSLKAELRKQTVAVYLNASSAGWRDYGSGVLMADQCNNKSGINHAVTAVGFGVLNSVEYVLIKNSWGASWGDNGYIRISLEQDATNTPDGACALYRFFGQIPDINLPATGGV